MIFSGKKKKEKKKDFMPKYSAIFYNFFSNCYRPNWIEKVSGQRFHASWCAGIS
jgi:hypothetical protein